MKGLLTDDLIKVRLCALLHDIGKPLCWALRKSWSHHVDFGLNILEYTFGKEIAKTAISHHTTKSYADFFHPHTPIERTISVADHIASGSDRPSTEDPTYSGAIPQLPVQMNHVLDKKTIAYEQDAAQLIAFSEDFKNIFRNSSLDRKTYDQVFNYLSNSILKKIPADSRYNDVSLFDHLRLTSAIAGCIWSQGYKNENAESYSFSVISADADRISAYINRSQRLPDLKAGSEKISNAVRKASLLVRQNIGPECIIFEGGGGFLALSETKFAPSIMQEANRAFQDAVEKDTTISIASTFASGLDLQRNFAEVWANAIKNMHDKKIIREEIAPALEAESSLCDVCKIRPAIHKLSRPLLVNTLPSFENLCNICKKRRDFGRTGQSIDEIADSNNLVSVLKVDGDDVGEIISGKRVKEIGKQPTPSRISTISRLIHESCESELSEVVQKNGGLTIYAGGDDILAILPGNKAFNTAIQMQETFSNIMGSSASISAGLSVFNYKIPIYVGLETAIERLKQAKNNEGKSSVSFDVLFGVAANSTTTRRAYKWPEFKELLEIVDFMGSGSTTAAATTTNFFASLGLLSARV